MTAKKDLVEITPYIFEIPKSTRADMKVPARVFTSKKMLDSLFQDKSLEQLINVATLDGIQKYAIAMPDIHQGYGFPIGGVAAVEYPNGVISPGGIGYDINCGVRLLKSNLTFESIVKYQDDLTKKLFAAVASGVGKGGRLVLDLKQLDQVLLLGVDYLDAQGYCEKGEIQSIESGGKLTSADPAAVSSYAKERGKNQLGSMGAGNHFVEVDKVAEIFERGVAEDFGLFKDQIVVLIHTGSRGLGHQVATDYIKVMLKSLDKYGIVLPDRELACAPFASKEGTDYFSAMAAAANFAWANRQLIAWEVRSVFQEMFGEKLTTLYDVAHNIAKLEEHQINGRIKKVLVMRKGATRAYPDQPVIIPGSMGTASYVMMGTNRSMLASFGSTCHGAGRTMSRHEAKRQISGQNLKNTLEKSGIMIKTGSLAGLAEEAPFAYKDVDEVVEITSKVGIAKKVVKLKPLVVVKG